MTDSTEDSQLASESPGVKRWLYQPEIDIYRNVRRFLIVAAAATCLHFVTDAAEGKLDPWIIFFLRILEAALFIGDVVVFLVALGVGVILQVRDILSLLRK